MDVTAVQRHTLRLLFGTQVLAGIGTTIGIAVGALLAARIGGTAVSGVASSMMVVGAAALAIPISKIMTGYGRRSGLVAAYAVGLVGSVLVVLATALDSLPLLLIGFAGFGGGSAANLQARYAAIDLATPERRARQLAVIVWATTLGAVAAPNLTSLADEAGTGLGLPALGGPFAASAVAFTIAAVVLFTFLRPDPLLTARALAPAQGNPRPTTLRDGFRAVFGNATARLGVASVAVGHLVMVGVMSMTPVHIDLQSGHGDADVLRIVGVVLSVHIVGMYAFSPLVGWLADRVGRRAVILGGAAVLAAACAVAGTSGHSTPWLTVGLFLLGLGWSATMVAGSTLLSESVTVEVRAAAQGLSDTVMGAAGAAAGALSGVVVELAGYPVLTLLAATAVVPLVALALRPLPTGPAPSSSGPVGQSPTDAADPIPDLGPVSNR
ncbi:MFS transporter [Asanoa iriomotensis]|uniref:MFS-type transporter YddS n=1 Tax=Asanoa iriomotensis TaxID=234613 RepID=A0ABQ4CAU0_9ACTN|nr:MFS transporter [Asanoa iriomotensis]GIF59883.1 putative MFS-type transporter YddS [Asanoa iriomotensis]